MPVSVYSSAFLRFAQDDTYFNLTPEVNASPTSALIAANSSMFAVPWKGGGGPFYVSSLKNTGKAEPSQAYTVNGHKSQVNDLQFHPFDESLLVSAGDDGRLLMWKLNNAPDRNMVESDAFASFKGAITVVFFLYPLRSFLRSYGFHFSFLSNM